MSKAIDMKMILLVSCKYNPFSKEMLCTWPHFDSESFWISKMACYCTSSTVSSFVTLGR